MVFDEGIDLIKDIDTTDEVTIEEIVETEFLTKDTVRKYQLRDYNRSLCLSNMFPEMSAPDYNNSVIVAPGEGKVPRNILHDDDWDIKAFPHLNSPDGKYGLYHERETKLTAQSYFVQRICNKNSKFAENPSFVYAAVAHTELNQLQRNLNLIHCHGKEVIDESGNKSMKMEDPYSVLEDIKQTPRYWRKAKYEMLARLDNLGPFHFFFTLSCADLRWDENFSAILRQKEGITLQYCIEEDEEGNPSTKIYINFPKEGRVIVKEMRKYLEEEVNETLHEYIRGNVLLATRYFNHRVKEFMKNIVQGGGNPMNVGNYSYKAEFQDRGAGHVHGTIWVNLKKIETLLKLPDGSLITKTEYDESKNTEKSKKPFEGLTSAFRKFRNGTKLDSDEEMAVVNFIDAFTTVSLNEEEVGKAVVRIVRQVNIHGHTKTCRKLIEILCRFGYPKYPIWMTILVKPYETEFPEEKQAYLKKYGEILKKVRAVMEDAEVIEEIMGKYNKEKESKVEYEKNRKKRILELLKIAGVDPNEYIEALSWCRAGFSLHQKRDLDEMYVNSYNPEWIMAWDGNIDIQLCLDFFAVITYITEYFLKDETKTMEILRQVVASNPDDDTKEKMKKVASTFLSHRQIGEAEAFYKLLPDLLLKKSSVACQWLPLGAPEDRFKRMKKAEESESKNLVKLDKVEGLWYEQPDILSKYKRRPEELEQMRFTHFGKMFASGGKTGPTETIDEEEEGIDLEECLE